jgi:ribose 5-phosphate isomerase B
MKIAIGADHAGYEYKPAIVGLLKQLGYDVFDYGTFSYDSTDYPSYAFLVASAVAKQEADYGILICGTGIGMSIAANKVKGIRAGAVQSTFAAKAIKEHNNANVLCLGTRTNTLEEVLMFVHIYLDTPYSNGERHSKRIHMISDFEEEQ